MKLTDIVLPLQKRQFVYYDRGSRGDYYNLYGKDYKSYPEFWHSFITVYIN